MKDSRTSFGITSEKLIEKDQFRVDLSNISMSNDTESKDFLKGFLLAEKFNLKIENKNCQTVKDLLFRMPSHCLQSFDWGVLSGLRVVTVDFRYKSTLQKIGEDEYRSLRKSLFLFRTLVSLVLFAHIDTQTSKMCCFEKDVPFSEDIEKFRGLGRKFYMLKFVYEIRITIFRLLKVLLMKIFFIKKPFMRYL